MRKILLSWLQDADRDKLDYIEGGIRLTFLLNYKNYRLKYWKKRGTGWSLVGTIDFSETLINSYQNDEALASTLGFRLRRGGSNKLYLANGGLYFHNYIKI